MYGVGVTCSGLMLLLRFISSLLRWISFKFEAGGISTVISGLLFFFSSLKMDMCSELRCDCCVHKWFSKFML
jgi:hypothetical protein